MKDRAGRGNQEQGIINLVALVVLAILAISLPLAVYVVQQQQEIRSRAKEFEGPYPTSFCGDTTCNAGENCSNCIADCNCATLPTPPPVPTTAVPTQPPVPTPTPYTGPLPGDYEKWRCPGAYCNRCGQYGWWGAGCTDFCAGGKCQPTAGPLTACGGFEKQCQPGSPPQCVGDKEYACGNDGCLLYPTGNDAKCQVAIQAAAAAKVEESIKTEAEKRCDEKYVESSLIWQDCVTQLNSQFKAEISRLNSQLALAKSYCYEADIRGESPAACYARLKEKIEKGGFNVDPKTGQAYLPAEVVTGDPACRGRDYISDGSIYYDCQNGERVSLEEATNRSVGRIAADLCTAEDVRTMERCRSEQQAKLKEGLAAVVDQLAAQDKECNQPTMTEFARESCRAAKKSQYNTPESLANIVGQSRAALSQCRVLFGADLASCMALQGIPILGAPTEPREKAVATLKCAEATGIRRLSDGSYYNCDKGELADAAAYQKYNSDHGGNVTREQFDKDQKDAWVRIEADLKNLGAGEAYLAKWQQGQILPTEVEKNLHEETDLFKNPLGAAALFVNNITGGALVRGAVGAQNYEGVRANMLSVTQDAETREKNLEAIRNNPDYLDWHNRTGGSAEDYQKLQLKTFVRIEQDLLNSGRLRQDNRLTAISGALRGEYNAVAQENNLKALKENIIISGAASVASAINAIPGLNAIIPNLAEKVASEETKEAQRTIASTLSYQDFVFVNPKLAKDFEKQAEDSKLYDAWKKDEQNKGKTVRDFQIEKMANLLALSEAARRGELPGKEIAAVILEQGGVLQQAALTGKLDVGVLRTSLEKLPQENRLTKQLRLVGTDQYEIHDQGPDQEKINQKASQLIIAAYTNSLPPDEKVKLDNQTKASAAYLAWASDPKNQNKNLDDFRAEQVEAMLPHKQDIDTMLTSAGGKPLSASCVLDGSCDYIGMQKRIESTGVVGQLAIQVNNWTGGSMLSGQLLLDASRRRYEAATTQGERNAAFVDALRGIAIETAKPVAITVATAVPVFRVAQFGLAGASALSAPTMLSIGGESLGMYFTADSVGQVAQNCTLHPDQDNVACARSMGMLVFSGASTVLASTQLNGLVRQAQALKLADQAALGSLAEVGSSVNAPQLTIDGLRASAEPAVGNIAAAVPKPGLVNQVAHKAVNGLGTVVFSANAYDTCTREGLATVDCALSVGMAGVSLARFVAPTTAVISPQTRTAQFVESADRVVNAGQAAVTCAAAVSGLATGDQCAAALGGAGLSAGSSLALGRGGLKAPKEGPRVELARVMEEAVAVKNAGEGQTVNVAGKNVTITAANRAEILTDIRTRLSQAMIAVGQADAQIATSLKRPAGDETRWSGAEKALVSAQNNWKNLFDPDGVPKKTLVDPSGKTVDVTPAAIEAARSAVYAADSVVSAEKTLLTDPRRLVTQVADRALGEGLGRLLGREPEIQRSYEAARQAFRQAALEDPQAPGRTERYKETLNKLTAAREELVARSYSRTQKEISAEIKPLDNRQKTLDSEFAKVKEESELLGSPAKAITALADAEAKGDGVAIARYRQLYDLSKDPQAAPREVVLRQTRMAELAQEWETVGRQITSLEAQRQRAGTLGARLGETLLGSRGNPNLLAETILGRTPPGLREATSLAQQVGRELLGTTLAEIEASRSRGTGLDQAIIETYEKRARPTDLPRTNPISPSQSTLYQEAFTQVKERLLVGRINDPGDVIAQRLATNIHDEIVAARRQLPVAERSGNIQNVQVDFTPKLRGMAVVGNVGDISRGLVINTAKQAYILSGGTVDFVSRLIPQRPEPPVTLTSESKNLVTVLSSQRGERGATAVQQGKGGAEPLLKLAVDEVEVERAGTKVKEQRTRVDLTEAGKKAGLTDSDQKVLLKIIRDFENWQSEATNGKIQSLRVSPGELLDQANFVIGALEQFGTKGARGAIFGALPGLGKTDVIIPLNVLIQARLTGESQFVVLPDHTIRDQFLRANQALVAFYESQFGQGSVVVIGGPGERLPTPEAIGKAKIVVATRDVAFSLRDIDTPEGAALRAKWKSSYLHSDETHWTFNPFENYQQTFGEQQKIIETATGREYLAAKDAVTGLSRVKELIEARKAGKTPDGLVKLADGSGRYSAEREMAILKEWLAAKGDSLAPELKVLLTETDLAKIERSLNDYLDQPQHLKDATGALGKELTLINKLADVLAGVNGLDYGFDSTGQAPAVAPREQGKITGRRYQGTADQILYNTVAADILGIKVDLDNLTISSRTRDINYAQLLFEPRGQAHYTGTPEPVAKLFEQAYGIKLTQYTDTAYNVVKDRLGQGNAKVFATLTEARVSADPAKNEVYINLDNNRANSITRDEIAKLHPGRKLFVVGGNGEFIEGVVDQNGVFGEIGRFSNRDELNSRTRALDGTGERYVKLYEYGAHTGVDTFNDVTLTHGTVIVGDVDATTFSQGVNRLRPDQSGHYPAVDLVFTGEPSAARSLETVERFVSANETKNLARGEILFKESLIRNSVDILVNDLEAKAGEKGLFGLGKPNDQLIARLEQIRESWKRTVELDYALGTGEVTPEVKLSRTLERVKAIYAQIEGAVAADPRVAARFDRLGRGYRNLTISFTSGAETGHRLGSPPALADVVTLINASSGKGRFADITFSERGPSPEVVTADAAGSARPVNVIADIDQVAAPVAELAAAAPAPAVAQPVAAAPGRLAQAIGGWGQAVTNLGLRFARPQLSASGQAVISAINSLFGASSINQVAQDILGRAQVTGAANYQTAAAAIDALAGEQVNALIGQLTTSSPQASAVVSAHQTDFVNYLAQSAKRLYREQLVAKEVAQGAGVSEEVVRLLPEVQVVAPDVPAMVVLAAQASGASPEMQALVSTLPDWRGRGLAFLGQRFEALARLVSRVKLPQLAPAVFLPTGPTALPTDATYDNLVSLVDLARSGDRQRQAELVGLTNDQIAVLAAKSFPNEPAEVAAIYAQTVSHARAFWQTEINRQTQLSAKRRTGNVIERGQELGSRAKAGWDALSNRVKVGVITATIVVVFIGNALVASLPLVSVLTSGVQPRAPPTPTVVEKKVEAPPTFVPTAVRPPPTAVLPPPAATQVPPTATTVPPTVTARPAALTAEQQRLKAWERPKNDNGLGIHFMVAGATGYYVNPSDEKNNPEKYASDVAGFDGYITEMKKMGMKWATVLYADDKQKQLEFAASRFKDSGIVPVWRHTLRAYQTRSADAWERDVNIVKAAGLPPYFQLYNEPFNEAEWDKRPVNRQATTNNWIAAARAVSRAGGYVGLQSLGSDELEWTLRYLKQTGNSSLFDRMFLALHLYAVNHPPDYTQDEIGVLGFRVFADVAQREIGFVPPMIVTEGGWRLDESQDNRYPKIDDRLHAEYTRRLFESFRTGTLPDGSRVPDYLFAFNPWAIYIDREGGGWFYDRFQAQNTRSITGVLQKSSTFTRQFSWDLPGAPAAAPAARATPVAPTAVVPSRPAGAVVDVAATNLRDRGDMNLKLRGWGPAKPTLGGKGFIDVAGKVDEKAPGLHTALNQRPEEVEFVELFVVNELDGKTPIKPNPDSNWGVTAARLGVKPGTPIQVPVTTNPPVFSGYPYKAIVLFATSESITMHYVPDDDIVKGYVVIFEDFETDPVVLSQYQKAVAEGRRQLPVLLEGQIVGKSRGKGPIVAIRDSGSFMDPRSRKDWWGGQPRAPFSATPPLMDVVKTRFSPIQPVSLLPTGPAQFGLADVSFALTDIALDRSEHAGDLTGLNEDLAKLQALRAILTGQSGYQNLLSRLNQEEAEVNRAIEAAERAQVRAPPSGALFATEQVSAAAYAQMTRFTTNLRLGLLRLVSKALYERELKNIEQNQLVADLIDRSKSPLVTLGGQTVDPWILKQVAQYYPGPEGIDRLIIYYRNLPENNVTTDAQLVTLATRLKRYQELVRVGPVVAPAVLEPNLALPPAEEGEPAAQPVVPAPQPQAPQIAQPVTQTEIDVSQPAPQGIRSRVAALFSKPAGEDFTRSLVREYGVLSEDEVKNGLDRVRVINPITFMAKTFQLIHRQTIQDMNRKNIQGRWNRGTYYIRNVVPISLVTTLFVGGVTITDEGVAKEAYVLPVTFPAVLNTYLSVTTPDLPILQRLTIFVVGALFQPLLSPYTYYHETVHLMVANYQTRYRWTYLTNENLTHFFAKRIMAKSTNNMGRLGRWTTPLAEANSAFFYLGSTGWLDYLLAELDKTEPRPGTAERHLANTYFARPGYEMSFVKFLEEKLGVDRAGRVIEIINTNKLGVLKHRDLQAVLAQAPILASQTPLPELRSVEVTAQPVAQPAAQPAAPAPQPQPAQPGAPQPQPVTVQPLTEEQVSGAPARRAIGRAAAAIDRAANRLFSQTLGPLIDRLGEQRYQGPEGAVRRAIDEQRIALFATDEAGNFLDPEINSLMQKLRDKTTPTPERTQTVNELRNRLNQQWTPIVLSARGSLSEDQVRQVLKQEVDAILAVARPKEAPSLKGTLLWQPLVPIIDSPRLSPAVKSTLKTVLSGSRKGVIARLINTTPLGIGRPRAEWNWRTATVDALTYWLTRQNPIIGPILGLYDTARLARWFTEKITKEESLFRQFAPERAQPAAPAQPAQPAPVAPVAPAAPVAVQSGLPGNIQVKNTLLPQYEQALKELPQNVPQAYKEQARLAAYYFQVLDTGEKLETVDGKDLTPVLQQFATDLADSAFAWLGDQFRLDRKKTEYPNWKQKFRRLRYELSQSELDQINTDINEYFQAFGKLKRSNDGQDYYFFSTDRGAKNARLTAGVSAAHNNKMYIEGAGLLKFTTLRQLFDQLASSNLHPDSMKLFEGGIRLVLYWNDLSSSDVQKIRGLLNTTGIYSRGPAQDPVYIYDKNGVPTVESFWSNDSALGESGYNQFIWKGEKYTPQEFIKQWLRLTFVVGKNPADPYRISFIPADPPDDPQTAAAFVQKIPSLDTAGLSVVVGTYGRGADLFNKQQIQDKISTVILPAQPVTALVQPLYIIDETLEEKLITSLLKMDLQAQTSYVGALLGDAAASVYGQTGNKATPAQIRPALRQAERSRFDHAVGDQWIDTPLLSIGDTIVVYENKEIGKSALRTLKFGFNKEVSDALVAGYQKLGLTLPLLDLLSTRPTPEINSILRQANLPEFLLPTDVIQKQTQYENSIKVQPPVQPAAPPVPAALPAAPPPAGGPALVVPPAAPQPAAPVPAPQPRPPSVDQELVQAQQKWQEVKSRALGLGITITPIVFEDRLDSLKQGIAALEAGIAAQEELERARNDRAQLLDQARNLQIDLSALLQSVGLPQDVKTITAGNALLKNAIANWQKEVEAAVARFNTLKQQLTPELVDRYGAVPIQLNASPTLVQVNSAITQLQQFLDKVKVTENVLQTLSLIKPLMLPPDILKAQQVLADTDAARRRQDVFGEKLTDTINLSQKAIKLAQSITETIQKAGPNIQAFAARDGRYGTRNKAIGIVTDLLKRLGVTPADLAALKTDQNELVGFTQKQLVPFVEAGVAISRREQAKAKPAPPAAKPSAAQVVADVVEVAAQTVAQEASRETPREKVVRAAQTSVVPPVAAATSAEKAARVAKFAVAAAKKALPSDEKAVKRLKPSPSVAEVVIERPRGEREIKAQAVRELLTWLVPVDVSTQVAKAAENIVRMMFVNKVSLTLKDTADIAELMKAEAFNSQLKQISADLGRQQQFLEEIKTLFTIIRIMSPPVEAYLDTLDQMKAANESAVADIVELQAQDRVDKPGEKMLPATPGTLSEFLDPNGPFRQFIDGELVGNGMGEKPAKQLIDALGLFVYNALRAAQPPGAQAPPVGPSVQPPAGFVVNPFPGAREKFIPEAWSKITPIEREEGVQNTEADRLADLQAYEVYLRTAPEQAGLTEAEIQVELSRASRDRLEPVTAIFERPLVAASKILRQKNIQTVFSSASGKSWSTTSLAFDGPSLSEENRKIIVQFRGEVIDNYRGSNRSVYIVTIDATSKTPEQISAEYLALANRLEDQTQAPGVSALPPAPAQPSAQSPKTILEQLNGQTDNFTLEIPAADVGKQLLPILETMLQSTDYKDYAVSMNYTVKSSEAVSIKLTLTKGKDVKTISFDIVTDAKSAEGFRFDNIKGQNLGVPNFLIDTRLNPKNLLAGINSNLKGTQITELSLDAGKLIISGRGGLNLAQPPLGITWKFTIPSVAALRESTIAIIQNPGLFLRQFTEGIGNAFQLLLGGGIPQPPTPEKPTPAVETMTQKVLSELSIDQPGLWQLPDGQKVIDFVTKRLIDPGFQKILPTAQLPANLKIWENGREVSSRRKQEILSQYQNNRPPLPVFRSFTVPKLLAAGYNLVNLDIGSLFSANQVGGSPKGIIGDYLIYDVVAAIERELGENYILVRTGGDEFAVATKLPVSDELAGRITAAASTVNSLYKEGDQIVFRPAKVKVTRTSPTDLAQELTTNTEPATTLPLGLRVNRLKTFHPELTSLVDSVMTLTDTTEISDTVKFMEEMLYDPVLDPITREFIGTGTNVEVFVDPTDFLGHLKQRSLTRVKLLRIDLPGVLKALNDTAGYDSGNAFLQWVFRRLVPAAATISSNLPAGKQDVLVYRRGGDFYLALPAEASVEGAVSVVSQALTGSYQAAGRTFPLAPAVAGTSMGLTQFIPAFEIPTGDERAFAQAREDLDSLVWQQTLLQLRTYYAQGNPSTSDWEFLANYFNPYDRRGSLRLSRISTDWVNALKPLYFDPAANKKTGVREGMMDQIQKLLIQVLTGQPAPVVSAPVSQAPSNLAERAKSFLNSLVPDSVKLWLLGRFGRGVVQPGPALPPAPAPSTAKQAEPTAMTRRDFLKLSAVGAVGLAGAYAELEKGILGDIARLGDRLEEFFNPISDLDNAAGAKNIHGVAVYGLNTPLHTPNDVEDLYTRLNHIFFDLGKQDLEAWIQRTRLEAQLTGNVLSLSVREILLKPNERYLEVVTRKSAYESFLRRKGETGVDFVQWVQMHVDTTNRMLEQAKPQSSKRAVLRRILIVDDSVTQDWSDRYEKEWKDTAKLGSALDVWYRKRFSSPMDTDTTWAIADDYRGSGGAYFWNVRQNADGTVTFSKFDETQKIMKTFTFPLKDDSLRDAHDAALDLGLIHEWSHYLLGLPDEYLLNVKVEGPFRFKGFYLDTGYFHEPYVSPYLSYLLKNPAKTVRAWELLNEHFNEIPKTITLRVSENAKPLEGKLSVYEATYPKGYYQSKRFSRSPTVEGEGPSLLLPPKLFGLKVSGKFTYYPTNWILRVHSENGEKELHLPVAAFNISKIAGNDAVTYNIVFTGYEDAKKPFQALQMVDAAELESYLENHRDNDPVYAYAKIDGTSTYFVWLLRDSSPLALPEEYQFVPVPTYDSNGNFRLDITDVPSDDLNYFLTVLQPLGQGRTITVMNTSGVPVEVGRVYRQVTYESNLKGKVTISPGQTTIRVDPDETVFVKESIQNDKPQKPLKIRLYNFSRSTEIKNIAWVMRGEDIYSLSTASMGVPLESLFQSIENHLISNFPGQTVVIVNDHPPSPVEAFKTNVTLFGVDIKPGETQTVTIPQTGTPDQKPLSMYPDTISVELLGGGVYTFDSTKNLEEWINDGIKGYWLKRGETLKMGNDLDREVEIFGIKIPSGETQIITIPKWTNMLEEAAQSFINNQLKDCGLGALRIFPQVYADEVGRGTGTCAWWARPLSEKERQWLRNQGWKMPWRVILGGAAIDLTR